MDLLEVMGGGLVCVWDGVCADRSEGLISSVRIRFMFHEVLDRRDWSRETLLGLRDGNGCSCTV